MLRQRRTSCVVLDQTGEDPLAEHKTEQAAVAIQKARRGQTARRGLVAQYGARKVLAAAAAGVASAGVVAKALSVSG